MPRKWRSLFPCLCAGVLAGAPAAALAGDGVRDPWGVLPQDQSRFHREGFAAALSLGPSVFFGTGSQADFGGIGATLRLRVGTSASPDMIWFAEFGGGSYLVEVPADTRGATDPPADGSDPTELVRNEEGTLTLGAQWFFGESFFVRGGAGIATSKARRREMRDTDLVVERRSGLALITAVGAHVYRRTSFAVDLELAVNSDIYGGGFLGRWQLAASLNLY